MTLFLIRSYLFPASSPVSSPSPVSLAKLLNPNKTEKLFSLKKGQVCILADKRQKKAVKRKN